MIKAPHPDPPAEYRRREKVLWLEVELGFTYTLRPFWTNSRELKEADMPRVCHFTGKKTRFGRKKTTRGKAKYLGGVGTKITGLSPRKFKPNIQRVRAVVDGQVVRIKVSTKAIRMGLVTKPVKRRWKPEAATAGA